MDWKQLDDEKVYTRKELKQKGLNYSSTQFLRWSDPKLYPAPLTPLKPGGAPSARVHYKGSDVKRFFTEQAPRH